MCAVIQLIVDGRACLVKNNALYAYDGDVLLLVPVDHILLLFKFGVCVCWVLCMCVLRVKMI